jgi:hypothetical protein
MIMSDEREMSRDTEEELEVFFKLLCWYLSAGTEHMAMEYLQVS